MRDKIRSIPLEYGDAVFRLFYIQLMPSVGRRESRAFSNHEHHYYELHFAMEGSYDYSVDGKKIRLQAGEVLILPPGLSHKTIPSGDPDYVCTVLELSLEKRTGTGGFYGYFKGTLDTLAARPLTVSTELLRQAWELKHTEFNDVIRGHCFLKARASTLLYQLFDEINGYRMGGRAAQAADRTDNLILLENLVGQNRSLKDIAAAINYSERHTARLIQSIYHKSLSQLKKEKKALEAQTSSQEKGAEKRRI